MRLIEIITEQKIQDESTAFNAVKKYALDYKRDPNLDEAAEFLLQQNPKVRYNGQMVRGIVFDLKAVKDIQSYLAKLQPKMNTGKFESWSKSMQGMTHAIMFNIDAGIYDVEFAAAVVVQQEGLALDVEVLLAQEQSWIDKESEEELLAKMNNSVHVLGIHWGNRLYNLQELEQLRVDFQKEMQYY